MPNDTQEYHTVSKANDNSEELLPRNHIRHRYCRICHKAFISFTCATGRLLVWFPTEVASTCFASSARGHDAPANHTGLSWKIAFAHFPTLPSASVSPPDRLPTGLCPSSEDCKKLKPCFYIFRDSQLTQKWNRAPPCLPLFPFVLPSFPIPSYPSPDYREWQECDIAWQSDIPSSFADITLSLLPYHRFSSMRHHRLRKVFLWSCSTSFHILS